MIHNIDNPLFTIIIPTKNRGEYLDSTIRTCICQDYSNIEIIISDDASTDNTSEIVNKYLNEDSRIRYFKHNNGLGMRDNFEFAINQVKSGYVIALGGDDGLIPGSITKMYEILKSTNTELLTWSNSFLIFPGYYNDSSKLIINRCKGVKKISSKNFLKSICENFNYFGNNFECPMFYIKGVASTNLVNRVKSRTSDNTFYSCPTPDGYSGIVLAGEVEYFSFTGEPLSIGGNSISSQGRAYLHNDKASREQTEDFLSSNKNRPMHKELANQPYSPLVSLMTADYLLTAKDLPGWSGNLPEINYKKLIESCFTELSNRYFEKSLIKRELLIIKKIAEYHNLGHYFEKLLIKNKRKVRERLSINGSIITPRSIIFDCKTLEIENIYEAALATKLLYNIYFKVNYRTPFMLIYKIFVTFIKSNKYKLEKFPSIYELK